MKAESKLDRNFASRKAAWLGGDSRGHIWHSVKVVAANIAGCDHPCRMTHAGQQLKAQRSD